MLLLVAAASLAGALGVGVGGTGEALLGCHAEVPHPDHLHEPGAARLGAGSAAGSAAGGDLAGSGQGAGRGRGPFGSTHPPTGSIAELRDAEVTPRLFFEEYMNLRRPLVIRGVGKGWPASQSAWTDERLDAVYGGMVMTLESKREDNPLPKSKATLHDFLAHHQHDSYIVSELPQPMYKDVQVPWCLQCGLLRDRLSEMNLWMSNGNTSSMLHRDGFNQLNCLVKGTKLWTVIDAHHIPRLPFIWEDGQDPLYTRGGVVDFTWEDVDFAQHPQLARTPYSQATLAAGDCIFVPGDYPHQVVSPAPGAAGGAGERNIQVSFLFGGVTAFARGTARENQPLAWVPQPRCEEGGAGAGAAADGGGAAGAPASLADHPVSWVYPGHGPSTLGSIDLVSVKLLLLQTIAGLRPWERLGSGDDDEEGGQAADALVLPETTTVDGCVGAVSDMAAGVLRADKGYPEHDVLQLQEYVDVVLRDGTLNVGSWEDAWAHKVEHVANQPDTYLQDTIVVPGLRDALLRTADAQARRVCTMLAGGGGSGSGGGGGGGGVITARALRTMPERYVSIHMLALVTMFNFADATRYANFVRQGKCPAPARMLAACACCTLAATRNPRATPRCPHVSSCTPQRCRARRPHWHRPTADPLCLCVDTRPCSRSRRQLEGRARPRRPMGRLPARRGRGLTPTTLQDWLAIPSTNYKYLDRRAASLSPPGGPLRL